MKPIRDPRIFIKYDSEFILVLPSGKHLYLKGTEEHDVIEIISDTLNDTVEGMYILRDPISGEIKLYKWHDNSEFWINLKFHYTNMLRYFGRFILYPFRYLSLKLSKDVYMFKLQSM